MINKYPLLSRVFLLAIMGLMLTSCNSAVHSNAPQFSSHRKSTGVLTDYSDKGINSLAARLHHSHAERTHIIVMGDSHTAADFLSGQLRQRFQDKYGNGGIGFISPVAVPGNRYGNVSFSKAKGWKLENSRRQNNPVFTLGGNIVTAVSGYAGVYITAQDGESDIRAQVLYRTHGGTTLQLGRHSLLLADSLGRWELSEVARVLSSFSISISGGSETQLAGLWLTSSQTKGVIISAIGINGSQIFMLDKWQDTWPDSLSLLNPDLVVLAYGTNEAFNTDLSLDKYRWTLVKQIKKIRQAKPGVAILLIGPGSSILHKDGMSCERRQPSLLKPIIKVQREVAESEHTLFWDWFAWMGGDCSIELLAKQGKARPDLIHLTSEGYRDSAAALWHDLESMLNQKIQ